MKILVDEEHIHQGIGQLADKLHAHYGNEPLTVVAIMTGSLVMLADLIRRLEMPVRISLIRASSYRGGTTSGDGSFALDANATVTATPEPGFTFLNIYIDNVFFVSST
jgi:hypoxanthine phosphoribosyltransferase